jgi:hypothetical protein
VVDTVSLVAPVKRGTYFIGQVYATFNIHEPVCITSGDAINDVKLLYPSRINDA